MGGVSDKIKVLGWRVLAGQFSSSGGFVAAPLLIFAYTDKSPYSQSYGFSLVAQTVKKLPAIHETWIPSLGWEDPLENGSNTLTI